MISYLMDILLCGFVVVGEIIGALILAAAIQVLVYRLTGFNIYKFIVKKLIK